MGNILQNMAGMGNMTEQVIANDFLIAAKNGVKNYAAALSESVTPEVRRVLKKHLDDALNMHEKITDYMMEKGYYNAYNPAEQMIVDFEAADTVKDL